MFKASTSGTGNQPKDDAAEFRGQYQHTREMYKIFNQVCAVVTVGVLNRGHF